jgi:hypothetical protein
MDLNVGKYTTTQEMFLAKVGITNSYQEDNTMLHEPFFVTKIFPLKTLWAYIGNTRDSIRIHQEELAVLCVHIQEKGYAYCVYA